jgi:hypothetical protein
MIVEGDKEGKKTPPLFVDTVFARALSLTWLMKPVSIQPAMPTRSLRRPKRVHAADEGEKDRFRAS